MHRTRLVDAECSVARSLDTLGDWWTLLIIRDALDGATRFDQFRSGLGIAPNMLARRLGELVEGGLLEKRPYQERPVRHEYLLTADGRALLPVIVALGEWGARGTGPEERTSVLTDRQTGEALEPLLVDARTGQVITAENARYEAGPAASVELRARFATIGSRAAAS
jgi:DNA-binding HxlR family transcriptional regulator